MLITTTPNIEGRRIKEYLGIVTGEAVVTDDWELYKEEIEVKRIPHQVCLAHMKKNFKKQIRKLPKEVPKYLTNTLTTLVDNPTQYGLLTLEALEDNKYLWSKLKGAVQTRELFAALLRKWKTYTEYCHNATIPKTNNHTERSIGRSKWRYRTTKGLKSKNGLLNFIAVTQIFGEHKFNLLKTYC